MSNRMIVYLAGLGVAGMIIILILNMATTLGVAGGRYLDPNDVRGIAVDARGKLWTLNFDQQKEVIEILNKAKPMQQPVGRQPEFVSYPGFDKLVVYYFDSKPNLTISPIGYVTTETSGIENLEFTASGWNPSGNLRETSGGRLKSLINSTFDPR